MEVPGRVDRETPVTSTDVQLFCTPCKEEYRQENADGFCEICHEYLCQTCISHHRKVRMTKKHKILQGEEMPLKASHDIFLETSCTEVCDQHSGEVIKYYCANHDVVGCGPCTTINHRTCKIDFIPDLAKRYKESNEYKTLLATITNIETQLSQLERSIEKQRTHSESINTKVVQDIRQSRKEINKYLDEAEENLLARAEKLHQENLRVLLDVQSRRETLQSQIVQIEEQFKRHSEEVTQLFITAKRVKKNVSKLKSDCSCLRDFSIKGYKFKTSKSLSEIASVFSSFCDVVYENIELPSLTGQSKLVCTDRSTGILDMKLKKSVEINMVHSNDTNLKGPWIAGLCLLSHDKLLTADFWNKALKLVDISRQKITSTMGLTSGPQDVTCLPDDRAAVTMPDEKTQIVSTHGGLSRVREIKVSDGCYGICSSEGKLVVTYTNPSKLEIIGVDGTVSKTVITDNKGNNVFANPQYITLLNTNSGKYIYVSDNRTNTVIKLTMEGEIVSQFKDERLSHPRGLVAIGDNHLAVCSYSGHKIIVIRDEDGKMEIVKQWDCVRYPLAIDFSPMNNTLYVSNAGSYCNKHVYVYTLSE